MRNFFHLMCQNWENLEGLLIKTNSTNDRKYFFSALIPSKDFFWKLTRKKNNNKQKTQMLDCENCDNIYSEIIKIQWVSLLTRMIFALVETGRHSCVQSCVYCASCYDRIHTHSVLQLVPSPLVWSVMSHWTLVSDGVRENRPTWRFIVQDVPEKKNTLARMWESATREHFSVEQRLDSDYFANGTLVRAAEKFRVVW